MSTFDKLIQLLKNKIRGAPAKDNNKISRKKNINKSSKKIIMSNSNVFNYGVGGNEIKVDANEAIQEIQENKTLLAGKLTSEGTVSPEIVTGLKTVEDVFRHFSPKVSVTHETENGTNITEEFNFKNLGDFSPKNIVRNSDFLNGLNIEQEQYNNIIRQLRSNKVLRNILTNSQTKAAFIEALKNVAAELENNSTKN